MNLWSRSLKTSLIRRGGSIVALAAIVSAGLTIATTPAFAAVASPRCDHAFGGTPGNETIHGNRRANRICARAGDDIVYAAGGNDEVYGGVGADYLKGQGGRDTIDGGDGGDALVGQSGSDVLYGDAGDDELIGGHGSDYLYGGDGHDFLSGGGGDDLVEAGPGGSFSFPQGVEGGAGDDVIYADLGGVENIYCGDGYDLVYIEADFRDFLVDCEDVRY